MIKVDNYQYFYPIILQFLTPNLISQPKNAGIKISIGINSTINFKAKSHLCVFLAEASGDIVLPDFDNTDVKGVENNKVYQIDLFYILIEDEDLSDDYTYVTYNYTTTTESPNIIVDLERLPDLSGSGSGDGQT